MSLLVWGGEHLSAHVIFHSTISICACTGLCTCDRTHLQVRYNNLSNLIVHARRNCRNTLRIDSPNAFINNIPLKRIKRDWSEKYLRLAIIYLHEMYSTWTSKPINLWTKNWAQVVENSHWNSDCFWGCHVLFWFLIFTISQHEWQISKCIKYIFLR